MARRERCRDLLGILAMLLSLIVESWAQASPGVEPVPAVDPTQPQSHRAAVVPTVVPASSLQAQTPQGQTAAQVAMAESAAVAMANLSGVPTAPPDSVQALPGTAITGAAGTMATATTFPAAGAPAVQECKVLSGDVAILMQVLLFVCSCAALTFKYRRESGDRTPFEFLMDSSKQLIGAGWIHVLNLSFAKGLETQFQAADQCEWYWVNIMLDCTLGVAVEYVLMLFLTSCIQKSYPGQAEDFESGEYKRQDGSCNPFKYIKQLGMWLLIVSLMKLFMCLLMALGHNNLVALAQTVLSPFESDPTMKLFVVMIFTPVCMNVFQFWMVDNFIKKKSKGNDPGTGDLEMDGSMRTRIQHGDM